MDNMKPCVSFHLKRRRTYIQTYFEWVLSDLYEVKENNVVQVKFYILENMT